MASRLSRFARALAVICAGTLAGLLLAEIGLRIVGVGDPSLGRVDPVTGWSGYPNASAWQRNEGTAFVQNNSAGFRDVEHSVEKPPGVFRVAVLGDSFTEAIQVPLEATFWTIAGKQLEACAASTGHARFEVLSFGTSGFGTAQELLMLRRAASYHPDLVILAFFTANDVVDNSRALSADPRKPYFVLNNGALELDDSFRNGSSYKREKIAYTLVRWSRIFQLLKRWVRVRESKAALEKREDHVWNEARLEVYHEPADPSWSEAWKVTEALLVRMRDDARAMGADFAVVTLSNGLQVYPDGDVRARKLRELGIDNPFYPDEKIAGMGAAHGFPVLNLAPAMLMEAQSRHVSLHGFANAFPNSGHWNEEGHRVAGTLLGRWLCGRLSSRGPAVEAPSAVAQPR